MKMSGLAVMFLLVSVGCAAKFKSIEGDDEKAKQGESLGADQGLNTKGSPVPPAAKGSSVPPETNPDQAKGEEPPADEPEGDVTKGQDKMTPSDEDNPPKNEDEPNNCNDNNADVGQNHEVGQNDDVGQNHGDDYPTENCKGDQGDKGDDLL